MLESCMSAPGQVFPALQQRAAVFREQRNDRKETDDDALRPVDEHHRVKVPVPENSEADGNTIKDDE